MTERARIIETPAARIASPGNGSSVPVTNKRPGSGALRIGMIVPGFSADEGDWCIPALRNLARELGRLHEVHVFALRYPARRSTYQVQDVTVHALGGGSTGGIGRLGLFTRTLARILAVHRRRRFQVLHGFWADEPGFLAVTAGRLAGIPIVVSLMGGELARLPEIGYGGQLDRVNPRLTGVAMRHADRVTVGSAFLQDIAVPWLEGRKVTRLPLGVDTKLFRPDVQPDEPRPLGEGGLRLLNVASLLPVKDQATLLRAFSLLSGPADIHLHIVGEGPLRDSLESLAVALGIGDRVTFHGAVPHGELPAYYRAADLCVLSSRYESQAVVVLEAAACGRATIGTAVGCLPELSDPAGVVPVGDAPALARVIAGVLRQPGAAAALGGHAFDTVAESYSIERAAAEVSAMYAEVVGARRSASQPG